MAQEALREMEKKIRKLKSLITKNRFFNCYSWELSPDNKEGVLEGFLLRLKEEYKTVLFVDVDIRIFENCKDEEHEAKLLIELINLRSIDKGYDVFDHQTISIADALIKWSNTLGEQALLVFHCFEDIYNENEKNILRSIRKSQRNEMSRYLGLLLLSTRPVSLWHLYPESDLDDRFVAISKY